MKNNSTNGSRGERELQAIYDTGERAERFYEKQMFDHLNTRMLSYLLRQEIMFIASSDSNGECDCSLRSGAPGFVHSLDPKTLVYPEYRGNGVMATLGNIRENPHVGLFFPDFYESTIGLHVTGQAAIVDNQELRSWPNLTKELRKATLISIGKKPERWVSIHVQEAYIHCSKHIPHLKPTGKKLFWGSDDKIEKGGDYFHVDSESDKR